MFQKLCCNVVKPAPETVPSKTAVPPTCTLPWVEKPAVEEARPRTYRESVVVTEATERVVKSKVVVALRLELKLEAKLAVKR